MDENYLTTLIQKLSLDHLRNDDPNYKFNQLQIAVQTESNTGVMGEFTNKCCFWSIYHGLQSLKIEFSNDLVELTPESLLYIAEFLEANTMIDTDNPDHFNCLVTLVNNLPDIQLQFFIGCNVNNTWMTTPDPSVIIGTGSQIIRILNKGIHFEYITTDPNKFINPIEKMNSELAIQQQHDVFQMIKQYKHNHEMSEQLATNINIIEEKINQKEKEADRFASEMLIEFMLAIDADEEKDRLLALQLENDDEI